MSKKSKRKHKRSSSSSSEEDKKASKRKEVTKSCRREKRKHESHAAKQEKSGSSRTKHGSQSTRHIKKPVYRQEKKATDQKPFKKAEDSTKTKHLQSHWENRSEKTKSSISGRDKTVSGSKTAEERPSKRLNTDIEGAAPKKTAKISEDCIDEKSSRRSPSKLKNLTSPGLVSVKQKEHRHYVQKKTGRAEAQPRPGNESSTLMIRESSRIGQPSKTGEPGQIGQPSKIVQPSKTRESSKIGEPSETGQPSKTGEPGKIRQPSKIVQPSKTREPSKIGEPSEIREPSKIGEPSKIEEPSKTGQPSKTSSVIKDYLVQKRIELVKKFCQRQQENDTNKKTILLTEAKSSVSPRKLSSISAKQERSSKLWKNVPLIPRSVMSFSHKTAGSSSAHEQKGSSPLLFSFKIPKKVKPKPIASTGDSHDAVSANKNVKHRTEISDSGAIIKNSTQETAQQPHSYLDASQSFSSKIQDKSFTFSNQFLTVSDTKNSKQETVQQHHSSLDASQSFSSKTQDTSSSLSNQFPGAYDAKNSKQESIQQHHSSSDVCMGFSSEGQNKSLSLSDQFPTVCNATSEPWCDQTQVVEELHLARTERKLEVDVLQSYGELTCMEIDPPEDGATDAYCKQPPQQDLIIILDTNILLSHLDYVKKIRSQGLGALGFPVLLIPWVVLQELDSLKRGKDLSGSVAHLAIPAISYIYNTLKSREPHLWGQSMQQASECSNGLSAENNDDRVLHCCLQYQSLHPGCAVILCTNDKNLCSKALLSGVKAFSKNDLEAEVGRARLGLHSLQSIETTMLPRPNPQLSSPVLRRSCTAAQPHTRERADLSVGVITKHEQQQQQLGGREEEVKWDLSRCISELEGSLREVLSDVVEVEMKAAYEDLWLEIVCLKPPWTLQDVLQCLKKHWIAIFGHIVPRKKLQTVLNLIEFFNSGKTLDCDATLAALREAKELVTAFGKSSSRVASAVSTMDNIFRDLQPQGESHHACDVVMNDDDEEDRQPIFSQVSHQEVWALFENIWSHVYQLSLEVFKALGFDCNTMQSAQPAGCPQPPQDALACLHKLSSMVSQLLQAFSSVLSLVPSLEEVQTLLSIITSNKIVNVDFTLTAKDLLDCFSQQEYREKLRVGGTQLLRLKEALDRCVEFSGQIITFAAQHEWNSVGTFAHQPNRSLE